MEEPIRTLKEVLDEAIKVTGKTDLYALDCEIMNQFKLATLQGTTAQLMIVVQALRTAAFAVTNAALNEIDNSDNSDLPDEEPVGEA